MKYAESVAGSTKSSRSKSISLKSFAPNNASRMQAQGGDDARSIRSQSSGFSRKQREITNRLR